MPLSIECVQSRRRAGRLRWKFQRGLPSGFQSRKRPPAQVSGFSQPDRSPLPKAANSFRCCSCFLVLLRCSIEPFSHLLEGIPSLQPDAVPFKTRSCRPRIFAFRFSLILCAHVTFWRGRREPQNVEGTSRIAIAYLAVWSCRRPSIHVPPCSPRDPDAVWLATDLGAVKVSKSSLFAKNADGSRASPIFQVGLLGESLRQGIPAYETLWRQLARMQLGLSRHIQELSDQTLSDTKAGRTVQRSM